MKTETMIDPLGRRWQVRTPSRRRERVRGLLGWQYLDPTEGLLLRARSIHTVGMRRSIDAVVLDAQLRVIDVILLRPGRVLLPRRRVRYVMETRPGSGLRPGDRLSRAARSRRG